eukprot:2785421-Ditylum_brightwellii.AAC.1
MVEMTLSNGSFEMSAASLSTLGSMSLYVMGDVVTTNYIGESALQMQERLKSEAEFVKAIVGRLSEWNENWG